MFHRLWSFFDRLSFFLSFDCLFLVFCITPFIFRSLFSSVCLSAYLQPSVSFLLSVFLCLFVFPLLFAFRHLSSFRRLSSVKCHHLIVSLPSSVLLSFFCRLSFIDCIPSSMSLSSIIYLSFVVYFPVVVCLALFAFCHLAVCLLLSIFRVLYFVFYLS